MIGRCLYVDLGWLCPYQIKEKTAEQLSQARLLFMHIARPPVIYSLFATLTSLPGVGPKMEQILAKKTGRHVIDLLRHLPVSVMTEPRGLLLTKQKTDRPPHLKYWFQRLTFPHPVHADLPA